jgi:hypothetical protein
VTTEQIRPLIVNEPILVKETNIDKKDKKKSWKPKFFKSSTVASTAIQKPISKIDNSAKAKKK